MNRKSFIPLFYFGTLISSIGTFAFNLALMAFLLKNGFRLNEAALLIGAQRIVLALVPALWGHFTDRWSPRLTVSLTEAAVALSSFALIWVWQGEKTSYQSLLIVCLLRSVILAVPMGSRAKISKLFSDESYVNNSRHAIWMNKVTQGAALFGGILACGSLHTSIFKLRFGWMQGPLF